MEREGFARRLHEAAIRTRESARLLIEEPLPDEMLFRLRLSASYDGNPLAEGERTFPSDRVLPLVRAEALQACSAERAVAELWRNGLVPEWIDLAVVGVTGGCTLIALTCCGRFTRDERVLYHQREGHPPFHVLGTRLPPDSVEGQKFTLFRWAECWTERDLDEIRLRPAKIESLALVGRSFTDEVISGLPEMPRLQRLRLCGTAVDGRGLTTLARFGELTSLQLAGQETFRVPRLQRELPVLETLSVHAPPRRPWGFSEFVARVPRLRRLELFALDAPFIGGQCPERVRAVEVVSRGVPREFELPTTLERLSVRVSSTSEDELLRWLRRVDHVGDLSLRGTPITDDAALRLVAMLRPASVDFVDTRVTEATVRRMRREQPQLHLLPALGD